MNSFWKKFLIRTGVLAGVIGASVGLTYGLTAHKHKQQLQTEYNKGYENAQTNEAFYKEQLEIYKNLVEEQNKTITNFTNRVNNLNNTVEQQKVQITTLNSQLETANARIQALESENTDYLTQITQLQARKTELEARVAELEQSGSDNSAEIAQLQEEINSLNGQITTLQNIIANNDSTIASLQTQVANYEEQVASLQTDIIANETLIQEYEAKISKLEESVAYLEAYFDVDVGENKSVVKFVVGKNNSIHNAQVVENGTTPTAVADPTSTEYMVFNGWMLNNEIVEPSSVEITENTTFIANITYKYDVKFVVEGVEDNTQIVTEGDNATWTKEEPTKDGQMFAGWVDKDGNLIDINNHPITENTIFIAKFIEPAGLFNAETDALIMPFSQMLEEGYFTLTNNVLTGGTKCDDDIYYLEGVLKLPNGIVEINNLVNKTSSSQVCYSNISGIELPNTLTTIGENAFPNMNQLKHLDIPASVNKISNDFKGNAYFSSSLQSFNYLGSLSDWMNIEFASTNTNPLARTRELVINGIKQTSITIPDNFTSIPDYCFSYCDSVETVEIPDTIETIGTSSFAYCKNLTELFIPDSVTSIKASAFRGSALNSVRLSNNVEVLESGVFAECKSLANIYLPISINSVAGSSAYNGPFYGCSSTLKIYCGASSSPTTFGQYWNYTGPSSKLTVKYSYTYEQFLAEINA